MPSAFTWLDQSEEQRRKVLDVVDLFKEQGTVDELGLGTVRDAFADLLFPGTSNLMTRASYYLFIAWMYLRFERQKIPSSEIAVKGKREELKLIERLLEAGESEGVIGRRARGSLVRLPSGLYWAGMKRLGICQFEGSQDSYHRSVDRFYERRRMMVKTDDGEPMGAARENWHPRVPPPPEAWPDKVGLALTRAQGEFLRDQISLCAPLSLFALLTRAKEAPSSVDYPWAHPDLAVFSDRIKWQLDHARNISEVMHGSALLYNLLLSELTSNDELIGEYRSKLTEWAEMLVARMPALQSWDRRDAWVCIESDGVRVPRPTRDFIDRWCEFAIDGDPAKVPSSQQARTLIINREKRLKGPLARVENKRAQELWQGASSFRRLQYRWSNASVIIQDIVHALHEKRDA
jgi:hypothetical protein